MSRVNDVGGVARLPADRAGRRRGTLPRRLGGARLRDEPGAHRCGGLQPRRVPRRDRADATAGLPRCVVSRAVVSCHRHALRRKGLVTAEDGGNAAPPRATLSTTPDRARPEGEGSQPAHRRANSRTVAHVPMEGTVAASDLELPHPGPAARASAGWFMIKGVSRIRVPGATSDRVRLGALRR